MTPHVMFTDRFLLMRADRLLSILLLLQVNRRLTAGQLAKRLEVSERTILRDMDAGPWTQYRIGEHAAQPQ